MGVLSALCKRVNTTKEMYCAKIAKRASLVLQPFRALAGIRRRNTASPAPQPKKQFRAYLAARARVAAFDPLRFNLI